MLSAESLPLVGSGCTLPPTNSGRVEGGRGNLGHAANVPFPTSAHRTVRADLPHTALRLASLRGTRRGIQRQKFETQETHFVDGFV